MTIGRFLRHRDDSDTYMNMITNGIYFRAGGNGDNFVMTGSATIINSSGTDKDTIIESLDYSNAFVMDAADNTATFNGEEFRVNEFNSSGSQLGSFYMSNGDFFIQSLSGGDMLQLVDAGATSDINANPYQEWHRSNGIGASLVRLGYFGFASTSNPDIWIKNEVTHGDIVFRTDNNVGIRINDENDKIHLESRDVDLSDAAFNGTHTFTFYGGGGNQSANPIHQIDFHNVDTSGAERVQAQIKTMPVYSGGHGIHMDFHVGDSSAAPTRAMRLEGTTSNVIVDNALTVGGDVKISNTLPQLLFNETDAPTDEKNWILDVTGGDMRLSTATDANPENRVLNALGIFRTSTGINNIILNGTEIDLNGNVDVGGNLNVKNPSTSNGLTIQQFTNGNVEIDNEDGGVILLRNNNVSNVSVGSNEVVINQDSADVDFRVESDSYTHAFFVDASDNSAKFNVPAEIEAADNLQTTYPLEVSNNANNYGISIGAYGMSNRSYGSTNIDYFIEAGNHLKLQAHDDVIIENPTEGWSHVFSNHDLILRSPNGGDNLQLIDAGATTGTDCHTYGEFHYANGIGASNTRVGIWGFASTGNEDYYLWNYTANGGFRFGCTNSTGTALFQLDELHVRGAGGAALILQDNSAAANNGIFDFRVDEGLLRGRIRNDALDAYRNWLRVYTTDHNAIDEVELSGDIIDLNSSDYAVVRSEFRVRPSSGNAYLNLQTQLQTGEDAILDFICESATTRFRQYDGANSYMDIIDNGQFGTLMRFGLDNQGYVNVLGSLWIGSSAYTIADDTGNHAFRLRNGNSGDKISIESNGSVQICIDENNNQTGKTFTVYANGNNVDGTKILELQEAGDFIVPSIYNFTTANASNVNVDSNGQLRRSTSSKRFKKNIKPIAKEVVNKVLDMNPIRYRSKSKSDPKDHSYYGLIAEELAEIDPRLVNFTEDNKPDGVQYERIVPLLVGMVQDLNDRITKLETKLEEKHA